jgi:tetratricopeptide (TPR) repeat protein
MEAPLAFVPFDKAAAGAAHPSADRPPTIVLLDYLSAVEREAKEHPCVLLLDDFHWADQESVRALAFLSRNVRRLPVLIVVAMRDFEAQEPSLQDVMDNLAKEGLARTVALHGLKEREALQLIGNAIQAETDDGNVEAAARFLMDQTGGNPYFLLETLRHLREEGLILVVDHKLVLKLPLKPGRKGVPIKVPDSVNELLTQRLRALSKDERDLLEGAAILGQEFEVAPLKDLLHTEGVKVGDLLGKLSSRGDLILAMDEDGTRFSFAHALLWETVRNSTPENTRKRWAGKLAPWWEGHRPADTERTVGLYEWGGMNAKALVCVDKVIAASLQMHAHERVAMYFDKGIALMVRETTPVAKITEWGLSVLDRLRADGGGNPWTEPICRRLITMDPPEPLSWELVVRLAHVLVGGRAKEAVQLLDKVEQATGQKPGTAPQALMGRVAVVRSILLYQDGKRDEAARLATRALTMLPEDDGVFLGSAYNLLGWIELDKERWKEATEHLEKGLLIAKERRVWGQIPHLLNLKAAIANLRGNLKTTEECLGEAAAASRDLGQVLNLCIYLSNLSFSRAEMGNLDGAEAAAMESLRVAEAFDQKWAQGTAAQALGQVLLKKRATHEASQFLKRARAEYEAMGSTEMILQMDIDMAELKGTDGDPSGALADLAKMEGHASLKQDMLANLRLLKARFAGNLGSSGEARSELEHALSEAREEGTRYWEGRTLLSLSDWERRFGSPQNASKALEEGRKILLECGVTNVEHFTGEIPGPGEKERTTVTKH